jgi:hypothetical protein
VFVSAGLSDQVCVVCDRRLVDIEAGRIRGQSARVDESTAGDDNQQRNHMTVTTEEGCDGLWHAVQGFRLGSSALPHFFSHSHLASAR